MLLACAALAGATAAKADTPPKIGMWNYAEVATFCSIGTTANGSALILMTSKSGASGVMLKPADQSAIVAGTDYPLKVSMNGSADFDITANAGEFGGAKVLFLPIKGNKIAAGEADGFALRASLNGAVLFDKDMHGSHDAFAAFVACGAKFPQS